MNEGTGERMTTPSEQAQRQADKQEDPGLGTIMSERRQLLNLAYRLLGSVPPMLAPPNLAEALP